MTALQIRVLHVDDDPALLDIAATFVERACENLDVTTETDPEQVLDRLDDVDCVVSDYDMPRMDGLELLERVRTDHPDLPFVLFTGNRTDGFAVDALASGATDVCRKQTGTDHYRLLAHRIQMAVERRRERERLAAECEKLRSVLSMAATELDSAVAEANRELESLDSDPPTAETAHGVQQTHARIRSIARELRKLDETEFLRSTGSLSLPADD